MAQNVQFQDKVMVVTGASSGIGENIAIMAASRGAHVMLCGRHEDRLAAAKEKCVKASGGHEGRFATVQGDLCQATARKRVIAATVEVFGRVDALIANAGMNLPDVGILTASEESYDQVMDVNVKSVFFLIQEAVPYLEKSKGCIVTMSSVSSVISSSPNIVYPMSKACIDHMTHCLALDLGPKGIRVNAVNPSFVPTRIRRYEGDDAANDQACQEVVSIESKRQPYQGRCLTLQEVAQSVLFLVSGEASFITGQCLLVDGGRNFTGSFGQMQNQ